ncbi:Rpn family recombination-promoting nuclease/putative transposase [Nocardia sp. NPDC059764]|uniref:Rpn family recombination-promoting nuclease/putative transposase n=1 Tax=Nocardia sp. NPDC059764 TaxID=3346939 RepID=UPI0036601878
MLSEAAVAHLDWDGMELQSCSFVPKELQSRYTDVLFRIRWDDRDAFVFMLIEHQSSTDELMAFRLEYMVAIWNRYLRHNQHARRLPVVIPVVVHCDPRGHRWSAPTELSDLLDVDRACGWRWESACRGCGFCWTIWVRLMWRPCGRGS